MPSGSEMPVEVIPDAPPKPSFAVKFESVRLTLAYFFLAIFLSLWAVAFMRQYPAVFKDVKEAAKAAKVAAPTKVTLDLANRPILFAFLGAFSSIVLFGAVASLIALIGYLAGEPAIRARIRNFFCAMTRPPRSVLGPFDAFTLFLLMYGVTICMQVGTMLSFIIRDKTMLAALSTLLMDYGWTAAVLAACILAHKSAGSWYGVRAFWPPWNSTGPVDERPLWKDIALGAATYPMILWLITVLALLTKLVLHVDDENAVVGIFARKPPPLAVAILSLTVTAGAAFFEETMFRGILYNALKKWVRPLYAAIIGALIFAAVHGIVSGFLSLFVLGLALTWLYEKTGRLAASMTLHFINNLASIAMLLVMNAG